MRAFNLTREQEWNPQRHVEKILARIGGGDVSVACWEPGQRSPYHCHPDATEIYFCFEGGGKMRTPSETIDVVPGAFVVHPAGEVHEYINGPCRTLLFRVRYGADMTAHHAEWRDNPSWTQTDADAEYYRRHPIGVGRISEASSADPISGLPDIGTMRGAHRQQPMCEGVIRGVNHRAGQRPDPVAIASLHLNSRARHDDDLQDL